MTPILEQFNYALRALQPFLDDPAYTDVQVNGAGEDGATEVFTKSRGVRQRHVVNLDRGTLHAIARHAAILNQHRADEVTPLAPGRLPNGMRCDVAVPSAVGTGKTAIAIRRKAAKPFRVSDLIERGVFSMTKKHSEVKERAVIGQCYELYLANKYPEMIMHAFRNGINVAFAGPMNTGKTTNLLAFTFEIPFDVRIATVEDTFELDDMPHPNAVHFHYPKNGTGVAQHTSEQCVETCLRMDFDEIINGEVRDGPGAWSMARVGISGHRVKLSLHADSAEDVPAALAAMAKQHRVGSTIDLADLTRIYAQIIDIVVYSEVVDGEKRVTQVWFDPESKCRGLPVTAARLTEGDDE